MFNFNNNSFPLHGHRKKNLQMSINFLAMLFDWFRITFEINIKFIYSIILKYSYIFFSFILLRIFTLILSFLYPLSPDIFFKYNLRCFFIFYYTFFLFFFLLFLRYISHLFFVLHRCYTFIFCFRSIIN